MNNILKLTVVLVLVITLFMPVTAMAADVLNVQETEAFSNLLTTHNITVIGSDAEMTKFQIAGLSDMLKKDNTSAITKYNNKLLTKADRMKITPKEILELHYYSLTPEEQKEFLSKVTNQVVNINTSKDGIILISYNINKLSVKATKKYTSAHEGTIKMQDTNTGEWGKAVIELTGYFTKTTSGKKWTIVNDEDDYDLDENSELPVQILSTTIYPGYGYEGSGTYHGNEINCQSFTQVACGFNDSSLSIYVYPNSSYNYATIGD